MKPGHEKFDDAQRRSKLELFKIAVSCFGVANCVATIAMAVFVLVEVDDTDFFTVCYSLSQAIMFGVAGLFVLVVEGKVLFPKEGKSRFANFVMNKLGLVVFYFWIGSLIMGGKNYVNETQRTMGRTIGIAGWVLSICNLVTACALEKNVERAPKFGVDFALDLADDASTIGADPTRKNSAGNSKPLDDIIIGSGNNPFDDAQSQV